MCPVQLGRQFRADVAEVPGFATVAGDARLAVWIGEGGDDVQLVLRAKLAMKANGGLQIDRPQAGCLEFVERYASTAATYAGLVFLVLTIVLYVPQFFLAHSAPIQVVAINFIFDTLLFGGTVLVIGRAIQGTEW